MFQPGIAPQGPTGSAGPTGPTGPAAVAGKIPNSYVELAAPTGTVSAALEDVSGMSLSITLDQSVEVVVTASFQISTQSGAAPSMIAVAVNIDGVDHDEYQRYLSGTSDAGIGAIVHRSATALSIGAHTIKLRFRRVSGAATPGLDKADLMVMAMQSAIGPTGPAVAISGSSADVALSADGATTVLAQTVTGLGASKSYVATLGIRVSVWPTAALTKASQYDCVVTAVAVTDGSSVATVAFLTPPAFGISLAHADMRTVACTVAASAGGFTISAARPTGVACKAAARWWIAESWREVTA